MLGLLSYEKIEQSNIINRVTKLRSNLWPAVLIFTDPTNTVTRQATFE